MHIGLVVDSVGNNTTLLQYVNFNDVAGTQIYTSQTVSFTLQYATPVLSKGTYHAALYWWSDFSTGHGNQIIASYHAGNHIINRSLTVEEIAK